MTRVYDSEMTMSAGSGLKSFDCPEFDRCSFDEEVHIAYGLKLKFHRCSVNFDVDHRLLGRRACVVLRTEMACEDDAYVHAKCNDKDLPRKSRSHMSYIIYERRYSGFQPPARVKLTLRIFLLLLNFFQIILILTVSQQMHDTYMYDMTTEMKVYILPHKYDTRLFPKVFPNIFLLSQVINIYT